MPKFALWHNKGPNPCHRVAFYYDGELTGNIKAAQAKYANGTQPIASQVIECSFCGHVFSSPIIRYLTEQEIEIDDGEGPYQKMECFE